MRRIILKTGRARNKYIKQNKFYEDCVALANPNFKANKQLKNDLKACRISSDDIRSKDGFEWHHKLGNTGNWSYMIDLNKLKKLGYVLL